MTIQQQLIELTQQSMREIHVFASLLSPDERNQVGKVDDWSPRDVLAHLAGGKKSHAARLVAFRRGEAEPEDTDWQTANAADWEADREWSFEQIMNTLDEGQKSLRQSLEAFSEIDFLVTSRYPWLHGRPLWRYIVGVDFLHTHSHLYQLYIERGEPGRAISLSEQATRLAGDLDSSGAWRGTLIYNQACVYALAGEKERALAELEAGLRLDPGLIQWSKQDTDLACLWEDPQYLRLVQELTPPVPEA